MDAVTAVLLAGGSGERMGTDTPKQFLDLNGRPVISYSLQSLDACASIGSVIVVLPEDVPDEIHALIDMPKVVSVATGGRSRQASLGSGLGCLPEETELVVVHDAARPAALPSLFEDVIDAVGEGFHGALAAIPIDDALKEVSESGEVIASVSKRGRWRAQTPQAFLRDPLEDALARADAQMATVEDCSQMVLEAGYRVRVVMGSQRNVKITHARDLAVCEALMRRP